MNAWVTIAGFCLSAAGVWVNWGLGYALLTGGLVLFIAGGLATRSERRS